MLVNKYIIPTLAACLILLAMSSCNSNKPPKEIPDINEFAKILADTHLTETILNQTPYSSKERTDKALNFYKNVLAENDITEEDFDKAMDWYTSHPEQYREAYDSCLVILTKKEAKWENIKLEEDKKNKELIAERERHNILRKTKSYTINNSYKEDRRIPFNIDVDTIDANEYKYKARYRFKTSNIKESLKLEIYAMHADSTIDTTSTAIESINRLHYANIEIGSDTLDNIINISGYLFDHDTSKIIPVTITNLRLEYIDKLDSISKQNPDSVEVNNTDTLKAANNEVAS